MNESDYEIVLKNEKPDISSSPPPRSLSALPILKLSLQAENYGS